jgi:hypothetical protein
MLPVLLKTNLKPSILLFVKDGKHNQAHNDEAYFLDEQRRYQRRKGGVTHAEAQVSYDKHVMRMLTIGPSIRMNINPNAFAFGQPHKFSAVSKVLYQ